MIDVLHILNQRRANYLTVWPEPVMPFASTSMLVLLHKVQFTCTNSHVGVHVDASHSMSSVLGSLPISCVLPTMSYGHVWNR